jgi:hypothetical protein
MSNTYSKRLAFLWNAFFKNRLPGPRILAALILFSAVLGAEVPSAVTYLVNPLRSVSGFTGDGRGNVYAVGVPHTDFVPTPGAAYPVKTGDLMSALVKLDPSGRVVFSTYVPGEASALTIDSEGNTFVFARQGPPGGASKYFLQTFDVLGANAIEHQIFVCAACGYVITRMATDSLGNVYLAGDTSTDIYTTSGALQSNRLQVDVFTLVSG